MKLLASHTPIPYQFFTPAVRDLLRISKMANSPNAINN